jgi:hypothetical protein
MLSRFRAVWGGAILGLLLSVVAFAAHALTFPELTGRVVDDAGILDPSTKAGLERKLAEFETKTTGQLVVVTLKSLQGTSIEDYGYQLGRHWQIGQKREERAGPPRCSRASVLFVHFLHDCPQRRQPRRWIHANRRGGTTRLARTNLHSDPGFVGIVGLVLVRRLPRGRRLLRRRRLVRRRRRLGELVTS